MEDNSKIIVFATTLLAALLTALYEVIYMLSHTP